MALLQPGAASRAFNVLKFSAGCQSLLQSFRHFSELPLKEAIAVGYPDADISQEWYLRQRTEIRLGNRVPSKAADVWIAPNAVVAGDVDLYDRVSVWFGAVLRGDLNNITIGSLSNVQDRTVIHAARTSPTGLPARTVVGNFVTIEPNCVLRSCRVGDNVIIGARSLLLEGSMVESNAILAPGSVLPPARRVPEGEVWAGTPARFVRKITKDEKYAFEEIAENIRRLAWSHSSEVLPHGTSWREVEKWRQGLVEKGQYSWFDHRSMRYNIRLIQEMEEKEKIQA